MAIFRRFLTHRHPRYGTPWIAILISAAIYASLALHSLGDLISIYVWLRAATTVLTVLSAWGMRRRHPDLPRAFRIPGGNLGLVYVIAMPLAMTYVVLRYSDAIALRWGTMGSCCRSSGLPSRENSLAKTQDSRLKTKDNDKGKEPRIEV